MDDDKLSRSRVGIAWDLSGGWVAAVGGVQVVLAIWGFLADRAGLPPTNNRHPDAWLPVLSFTGWIAAGFASALLVVLWKAASLISQKNARLIAVSESGPKLVGHIDLVCEISGYKGGRVLILLVNMTNRGTPSVAHRWRVYVAPEGELEREAGTIYMDRELTIRFSNGKLKKIKGHESIIERVAHEPIAAGGGKRGWLFASLKEPLRLGTRVTVRFTDVNGREWSAERVITKDTAMDEIGKFPGVDVVGAKSADQPFDVTPLDRDS